MDTSKEYIKMCKKAEEIQEQRKVQKDYITGDFVVTEAQLRLGIPYYIYEQTTYDKLVKMDLFDKDSGTNPWIWLPRQDQLQEMVESTVGLHTVNDLERYVGGTVYDSWEQLWLALVMLEKYNKVWNGEDWTEED